MLPDGVTIFPFPLLSVLPIVYAEDQRGRVLHQHARRLGCSWSAAIPIAVIAILMRDFNLIGEIIS